MGKYERLIGQPAYRTKNTNLDYRVGVIERDLMSFLPFMPSLIIRFPDKRGLLCNPKDIIVVDENGKDLGSGEDFLI